MSGHRAHLGSKPAREIFLTSSSLSFSSLSSTCTSWNDAIELTTKESISSCEDTSQHKGKVSNAPPTQGSEISGLTHHVRMQPAPTLPLWVPPGQFMNKGLGHYDPERISASVFSKTGDGCWSEISNDSLFSLNVDGQRMSTSRAFRMSNIRPEDVIMPGEYLSYSPSLLVQPQDAEEKKRSDVKEIKSAETDTHQQKSSSTAIVSCSTKPGNSYSLDQAPLPPPMKTQSFALPVGEKKSKKKKKTRKSKKKKDKCCVLCSRFSECECNLCCFKWCCRGQKSMVLDASS